MQCHEVAKFIRVLVETFHDVAEATIAYVTWATKNWPLVVLGYLVVLAAAAMLYQMVTKREGP